jgi:hypothetical protein
MKATQNLANNCLFNDKETIDHKCQQRALVKTVSVINFWFTSFL